LVRAGPEKPGCFAASPRLTEVDDGEIHLLGRSIKLMRSGQLRAARRDIGLVL
jgi:ABC-type methionine transport system ATPase subunit